MNVKKIIPRKKYKRWIKIAKKLNGLKATGKIVALNFEKNRITVELAKGFNACDWQVYKKKIEIRIIT